MHAIQPATTAAASRPSATRRVDVRQHRRVAGLFDIWLEQHPDGGVAVPADPEVSLTARHLADLVRRSGDPSDDVRMLTDNGTCRSALFGEVAGLLGRDVLVTPDGADVRHRQHGDDAERIFDAVALDRVTRQQVDWVVIQPPDLATSLPGWFAVDRGVVRPRTGVVGLPLPDGLALATRADFVTRRAAAYRLRTGFAGLATVAVTVRAGAFLVGDYDGTQEVHAGHRLGAILADLPLYGCDLRLWLTWPSDPDEQRRLAANVAELAETVGATVWTPPPGGAAELLDDGHDLRAVDRTGAPGGWQSHRPARATGEPAFRSDPDGCLVPVGTADPVRTEARSPAVGGRPSTVTVRPGQQPAVVAEDRRAPALGIPWLRRWQHVNADTFEVFVASTREPQRAAVDGVPSSDLFLIGRLDPHPLRAARAAPHLLRIRVEPGGAIPVTSMRSHIPASLQHLLGVHDAYLLPAGRLDRLRLLAGYRICDAGRLSADGEFDDAPVLLDCGDAGHGVAGLPNDVPRWPASRSQWAYALAPIPSTPLPQGWLRLYRRAPAVVDGHLLMKVRVPESRAIDVPATAEALAKLPAVRSRAEELRSAGLELIVPSRSYDRLTVHHVFDASQSAWCRRHGTTHGPLSTVLADLQSAAAAS
jgi:hypothetical protein